MKRREFVNKFWDAFQQSIVMQATLSVGLMFTTCFLWARGLDVPKQLITFDSIVLGFWFASKALSLTVREIRK